jgi:hypothetical protein
VLIPQNFSSTFRAKSVTLFSSLSMRDAPYYAVMLALSVITVYASMVIYRNRTPVVPPTSPPVTQPLSAPVLGIDQPCVSGSKAVAPGGTVTAICVNGVMSAAVPNP